MSRFGLSAALSLCVCAATGAVAKDSIAFDVLEYHGCTLGEQSRAELVAGGMDVEALEDLVERHVSEGTARREREYVVFAQEVCTIRLPRITSDARLSDPDIAAAISGPTEFVEMQQELNAEFGGDSSGEGCFFNDLLAVFEEREGGERGAGVLPHLRFVAAHLISGDVRIYETSPLRTPIGMRVLTDDCANTEGAAQIIANHAFFDEGFGRYVRALGADAICDDGLTMVGVQESLMLQGADLSTLDHGSENANPTVNFLLHLEFELIARAAGWYDGMSATERGDPRPPLCRYR